MTVVDDPDDPRLEPFRRDERGLASRAERRDDRGAGWFLAEGDLVVQRALEAGCRPVVALADAIRPPAVDALHRAGAEVLHAGEQVRRHVTRMGRVHPIVAVFERPARPPASELIARCHRLVAVEAVDNPANIGSIVRNAAALGWDGLLLDRTSADPLARRSLRVAMGTAFSLPHARTSDITGTIAAAADRAVIALTPAPDAVPIDELRAGGSALDPNRPRILLLGAERSGLSATLTSLATHRVRIPMTGGIDSLNVAAAAAIACHVLR